MGDKASRGGVGTPRAVFRRTLPNGSTDRYGPEATDRPIAVTSGSRPNEKPPINDNRLPRSFVYNRPAG